ncbi:MAG: sulfurtransferase [Gloeomargaritaceae cyanobacterium C42_A2020_066]|nr:sulfurtransferase [Gloeomargaritaceae cyanobacterium C42_A2020_066]
MAIHPVITVAELVARLDDPRLVVVDCRFDLSQPPRGRALYDQGHIPGAHYLDLNRDLSGPVRNHGGRHPLPDPGDLAHTLGAMGVTADSLVVAYDDSRLAFAARLWWLIRYLGHPQVAVLDGGFAAYQAAGRPTTRAVPGPRPGQFTPQIQAAWVVDRATVQARKDLPQVALVDAREPSRYRGDYEPIDPVAGHIPGALNLPWQAATTPEGLLHPPDVHQANWQQVLSPHTQEVMVYCGSGVTACVNLLSLALAGRPPAQLYAGSWSDWCTYPTPLPGEEPHP